jgi:hypothetical protein
MFGENRFGDNEDYSEYYQSTGGTLRGDLVNELIRKAYNYLDIRDPGIAPQKVHPLFVVVIMT